MRGRFRGFAFEGRNVFRRIFLGRNDRPEHGQEQKRRADIEGDPDRWRDDARLGDIADAQHLRQQPGQGRGEDGADADEKALHRKACGALLIRQQVADKGAKRLHRNVDRGVHDPEPGGGEPKAWRVRHDQERQRREDRAHQKVGAAAAQRAPGSVAHMTDDRLDQKTRKRRSDPQDRQAFDVGAQGLENAAGVGVLQAKADLNAEEPETHVPDLAE